MTEREQSIVEILKREIRLVSAGNGEACAECGEVLDGTWRVKDGNIEHIAKLIAAHVDGEELDGGKK